MDVSALRELRRSRHAREHIQRTGWYHSIELPGGVVTDGHHTIENLRRRAQRFPIPEDLRGKRVLDIGAWDGWFSFEMERRGAEVVAVDCADMPNFRTAHRLLRSRVDYRVMEIYHLTPERVGQFDIVLCLGVLYHLKHPLLALERVCSVTREMACVESFVIDPTIGAAGSGRAAFPWMEFYESDELGGQLDNWCGPTLECVAAMARTAGFARTRIEGIVMESGAVTCYRQWPLPPVDAAPPPTLHGCVNSRTGGINYWSHWDEYAICFFESAAAGLTCDSVFAETGGFGVRPVFVQQVAAHEWQANFRIPPGLAPGWHRARVRTMGSAWSGDWPVVIDVPAASDHLSIREPCDGIDWTPGFARIRSDGACHISIWTAGIGDNADFANTFVETGPDWDKVPLEFLGEPTADGLRQINIRLERPKQGEWALRVRFGESVSNSAKVRIIVDGD